MGKTVTTYLIDGDPKGTQYVFISNKISLKLISLKLIVLSYERQYCNTTF